MTGFTDKAARGNFIVAYSEGSPAKPAIYQATFWANANNCTTNPDKLEQETVIQWQYHCPADNNVGLYLIKDSGHAWHGGQKDNSRADEPSLSLNATDHIWTFFKLQSKQIIKE